MKVRFFFSLQNFGCLPLGSLPWHFHMKFYLLFSVCNGMKHDFLEKIGYRDFFFFHHCLNRPLGGPT